MGSRTNLKRIVASAAAILLVACSNNPSGSKKATQGYDGPARIGSPAPGFSEPTSQGKSLALASLRGKVVYLNFFATWCPPCNEEAPAIEGLQREFARRGLQVVGIDVLENAQQATRFRREHRLSYPAVVDDGTLRSQYAVNGLPVHVFIDREGTVRNIVIGELSTQGMRANILRLL